jgi:peptidoglycan/LPS O-acetylase OafA/YrhL
LIGCILMQWYTQGSMAGIVAVISIAGVFAATRSWLRWLEVRPLLFLGTISYSLYLIHQNIGYVVLRACYARGFNNYLGIDGGRGSDFARDGNDVRYRAARDACDSRLVSPLFQDV